MILSLFTYFRGSVSEFAGKADLGLDVGGAASAGGGGGGEWRRGGAEVALKDGHDKEHGDENGGGDEAEGDGVDGAVKVGPMLVSVDVQRSTDWWPPIGLLSDHHFCCKLRLSCTAMLMLLLFLLTFFVARERERVK